MISIAKSYKLSGIEAVPVTIETAIIQGIGIHIVGLAVEQVKESLLRTITALLTCGYSIPGKKIIINIAPADLSKTGSAYDLPMALSILAATEQESLPDIDKYIIMGELGLDGCVRYVEGAVSAACMDLQDIKGIIVAEETAAEAVLADRMPVYGIKHLKEAIDILKDSGNTKPMKRKQEKETTGELAFDKIKTKHTATLTAAIAAAGGHGVVIIGEPGTDKANIAKAITELMPPLTDEEILTNDKIYSASAVNGTHGKRPFRAPHFGASIVSLIGGGGNSWIMPGEVTLAHNGVLFLDDCIMFPKSIMEMLCAPLEDKKITISRLKGKVEYPADFLPVLAMTPCPFGHYEKKECTEEQKKAWFEKLNGSIYSKIDLHYCCPNKQEPTPGETYEELCGKIVRAREIQHLRNKDGKLNAETDIRTLLDTVDKPAMENFENTMTNLNMPASVYTRTVRIARTIADLEDSEKISIDHLNKALDYRLIDKLTVKQNDNENHH